MAFHHRGEVFVSSDIEKALQLCRQVRNLTPVSPLELDLADALSGTVYEIERLQNALRKIAELRGTISCTKELHTACSSDCPIGIAIQALNANPSKPD